MRQQPVPFILLSNSVLHASLSGPAANTPRHADRSRAFLARAIFPHSTASREDRATVRDNWAEILTRRSDMRDNQLDALVHARTGKVRVVARGQRALSLVHAQVVGGGAAEGRSHGGRGVRQTGHVTVAVCQGGEAGAAALDGSGEHGLAATVELGEIVPCVGGGQG
jgi:hypothetical protein